MLFHGLFPVVDTWTAAAAGLRCIHAVKEATSEAIVMILRLCVSLILLLSNRLRIVRIYSMDRSGGCLSLTLFSFCGDKLFNLFFACFKTNRVA